MRKRNKRTDCSTTEELKNYVVTIEVTNVNYVTYKASSEESALERAYNETRSEISAGEYYLDDDTDVFCSNVELLQERKVNPYISS